MLPESGGSAFWAAIATAVSGVALFVLRWLKELRANREKARSAHETVIENRISSDIEAARALRDELRSDLTAAEAKNDRMGKIIEMLQLRVQELQLRIQELQLRVFELEAERAKRNLGESK